MRQVKPATNAASSGLLRVPALDTAASLPNGARVIIGGAKLGLGGVRTHLALLCRLLLAQGTGVVVFAMGSDWGSRLVAELTDLGAQFVTPPPRLCQTPILGALYSTMTWPWSMPRTANSLYCIGPGRSHVLLHLLRPRGTKSVYHEIVFPSGHNTPERQRAALLDLTVANSRKVARMVRHYCPRKPIRVIPFLTSNAPMPPPVRSRAVGRGALRVTYLGRLVKHKRPDQLVRCWKALSGTPALNLASLNVYGYDPGGEMLKELRRFVGDSDIADRVRIRGNYEPEGLARILAETDLVVLPSLEEGLPLVLVEAMLHGVPFVATAAGGTEELAEDNQDVLVTGKEWGEFTGGLLQMAGRIRAGEIDALRLHRWAEERYGYAAVSRQWLACLHQPRRFFGLYD